MSENKIWTPEKIELLKAYVIQGLTLNEIAKCMEMTYSQVEVAIRRYDIRSKAEAGIKRVKKAKPEEDSQNIIESLKEALAQCEPYIASPEIAKKGDTLVIHLTDLHAGKEVTDQDGKIIYDQIIFRKRIDKLCSQILKLLDNNISKGVPITDAVILATGDLANGENIYPTQAFEQELAPPAQVMLVVEVISKLITALVDRKLTVKFYGVRGNHGRTAKDADTSSNWDIMVFMVLDLWARKILKNPNVFIRYAETEQMRLEIRGHGYLIRHICPEQVDSPAGRVKINEWARRHKVEAIVYGHFHHAGIFECDNVRVIRGGSTVGVDSLSESMAKSSDPLQIVFGVNDQRVTTFMYFVDLKD
jgi:predicted phosphodiesterase